jgi:pilus assembly protein Flp/PilA
VSATRSSLEHRQTHVTTPGMQLRDWVALLRIELRREDGQTMTEYGVLLALIVVGVVGVLAVMGPKIVGAFSYVNAHMP